MYYYTVSLALSGIWKSSVYTYSHADVLSIGQIVLCPFGSKNFLGIVTDSTTKPEFTTKPIAEITTHTIPKEALALHDWIQNYYPSAPGQTTQNFLPSFLKKEIVASQDDTSTDKIIELPELTAVQSAALAVIDSSSPKPVVLHGVTGSGKTRVYMELAKEQLAQGKDILLLYPEISLTSQLKKTLSMYFGNTSVNVYHSKRTSKEQRTTWARSLNTHERKPTIFIGPRSALFLPHSNLGLIIVDEAHENSYSQDNGSRYNGLFLAAKLASIHHSQIVYGSATPPVAETQQILSKSGVLVCMHKTAIQVKVETKMHVIDMTDKKNLSTASYLLSKQLLQQIKQSLDDRKQSLIFLNRRGTAKLLSCDNCGWHAVCDRCETPLTYHHDTHIMKCHICGNNENTPTACPDCNHSLSQKTPGIKSIEVELSKLFPHATIARFDSDNKKSESLNERFSDVASGKIDILIGTQLLTKGLDLPMLETVGILQADSGLFLPDYTSEERTFQQLTQVSGRVGRGHTTTENHVFYQSYSPKSSILAHASSQDWHSFYEKELISRQKSDYPPYVHIMKIWVLKHSLKQAEQAISKIANTLRSQQGLVVLGPAPSFYEKSADKYSWQILVKSNSRASLVNVTEKLPKDTLFDLDPTSLL
jgi:primosomal protein N' (replication factor Y)